MLVLEYAPGGDLAEYVTKHRGLPEDVGRWFFQQLVIAVDYLHRMVRAPGMAGRRTGMPRHCKHGLRLLACFAALAWAAPLRCSTVGPQAAGLKLSPPKRAAGRDQPGHQTGKHAAGLQPSAADQGAGWRGS